MKAPESAGGVRNLVLVLGDQLDVDAAAFDGFDRARDAVLMMEVDEEAKYIPQHKQRLVLFFSAMRHFRGALRERRRKVHYVALDDVDNRGSLYGETLHRLEGARPQRVLLTAPGDYRVLEALSAAARDAGVVLEVRADRHFYAGAEVFEEYAATRKSLVMEHFYRQMRRRHHVLMDDGRPQGGRWNFDADNRASLGKGGPGVIPRPRRFAPDALTREVMALVQRTFPNSPGRLESFDYAVTPQQANLALKDFIQNRLPLFGRYQDAMASGEPYLYHSLLSSALNLHLLDPRVAVEAVVNAGAADHAPLNAVEGFVRQVLGWREYIRGIYWLKMPGYAGLNFLNAELPMPAFMWTAETEMRCVSESVRQLIDYAYAHHIQRLMVLGLFALLLGVDPFAVHRWHMSMYADAVDWVSLPNVLGMSQYADDGIVGTKPYCASGNYVNRMSNYCSGCRYDPAKSYGDDACPFTTLYWDFLMRHRERFEGNQRMGFQLRNLDRKSRSEQRAVRKTAKRVKAEMTDETNV